PPTSVSARTGSAPGWCPPSRSRSSAEPVPPGGHDRVVVAGTCPFGRGNAGMTVEVGSEAPDFTLNDYNKQPVQLSSFRGDKPVLLVFYPFAFSGICTGELCQLRDEFADYDGKGVQ